jgi:magnesium chelatase family protein
MPLGWAKSLSVGLQGVQGHVVEIEVNIGSGLPRTVLVGLPDAALSEARDRCKAAVCNSGITWPNRLLTVALSPADLPKKGAHFDLGIALAVLAAAEEVPAERVADVVVLGELALDGRLRAVPGVLPAVLAAAGKGVDRVIVPEPNADEAMLVEGVEVLGVRSLAQVVALLRGEVPPEAPPVPPLPREARLLGASCRSDLDLSDVVGQPEARRTLEVAAAGRHHVLLDGPPGAGKTMLAERLPGLMPDLAHAEALEVTAVHSVAGVLPPDLPLITRPPLLDPHHSASTAAIVGGGSRIIRPGAMSLAHHGVLFLDEAPEFHRDVLEALRQPLESGEVAIGRAERDSRFPARFLLVLAANPCPCGGVSGRPTDCQCTPVTLRRYRDRISGPIRDRIDLQRTVRPVTARAMRAGLEHAESSAVVAQRVAEAVDRQRHRLRGTAWTRNAEVPGPVMRQRFRPDADAMRVIEDGLSRGRLSARGADRVLRVAWTLTDLAGRDRPDIDEVSEAFLLRTSAALPGRVETPVG